MHRWSRCIRLVLCCALFVAACGDDDSDSQEGVVDEDPSETTESREDQRFPDVVDVKVEPNGDTYDFDVTISSPYDTAERYADGWRITGQDGSVYGEHELAHDHADEQPFTRTQSGVEIPEGVDEVTVEGRDSENGYGGETVTVSLPDS